MGGTGIPQGVTAMSFATTSAVLRAVKASPILISIKLACVGHLNTTAADANPACRGI